MKYFHNLENNDVRRYGRDALLEIYEKKALGETYLNSLNLPLMLLNANEIPPKDSLLCYERRNFPFWVFEFIVRGQGTVKIEEESFSVSQGDIYILPRNRSHFIFARKEAPWIKRYFRLTGTLPEMLLKSYNLENRYFFPQCREEHFQHIFQEMIELFRLKSHDMNDRAALLLLQLIQYLANRASGEVPLTTQALKIRHYLDRMLYGKLNLDRMSRDLSIPRNRIIQVCREELKRTPYDYFLARKIDIAKSMLNVRDIRISEVAAKLNFTDQYHFSRVFKQKTGTSPSDFRARETRES